MKSIPLGTTGTTVSRFAMGCMLFGTSTDEATSRRMLDTFVDAGGDHVDTANCYAWWIGSGENVGDESENVIGRWLADDPSRRDRIFLATKGSGRMRDFAGLWDGEGRPDWDLARSRYEGAGADTLRAALDGSLRRLGTDHIDLYYVHVDDRSTPLEETLETLHGFVTSGKVRYLGWSNVRTWRLERIRALAAANGWTAPVALQQQYGYLQRGAGVDNASIVGDEQLDYLRAHPDLTLFAYSPTLRGTYDDDAKWAADWQRDIFAGEWNDARRALVRTLAAEVGCTPTQLVLAWLGESADPAISPIFGVRTWEQFTSNLAATGIELPREVLDRLAAGA